MRKDKRHEDGKGNKKCGEKRNMAEIISPLKINDAFPLRLNDITK